MTKYNEAQVDFRDKSKGRIARQLEISELQLIVTCVLVLNRNTRAATRYLKSHMDVWPPGGGLQF